jgi:hypothetical protein
MQPISIHSVPKLQELEVEISKSISSEDKKLSNLINSYLEELSGHVQKPGIQEKFNFIYKVIKQVPSEVDQTAQIKRLNGLQKIWSQIFNPPANVLPSQRNVFANSMLDPNSIRLIASYLDVPSRLHLYQATVPATRALEQTNRNTLNLSTAVNISAVLQEIDPHKYNKEITALNRLALLEGPIVGRQKLIAPFLMKNEKDKLLNAEIYKILQEAWKANLQLREHSTLAVFVVSQEPHELKKISPHIQNYREIALTAVSNDGMALKHVSEALKKDREIILAAAKNNGLVLADLPDEFKNDREIVLAAVRSAGSALKDAPEEFQKDREIVLAAVTNDGRVLADLSDAFKKDREIVLAAVRSTGRALEHAHEDLQDVEEIVLAAVSNEGAALFYASERLQDNEEIVLAAVRNDGRALLYVSERLQDNELVVLVAIHNNGWGLSHASDRLKDNKEFALIAINMAALLPGMTSAKIGVQSIFRHLSDRLKNDPEIVKAAIEKNSWDLDRASKQMQLRVDLFVTSLKNRDVNSLYLSALVVQFGFNKVYSLFSGAVSGISGLFSRARS